MKHNKRTRDLARKDLCWRYSLPRNRSAAMEMTMGTMVTIVLLTMVLILGGYFISKVYSSGMDNIDNIDTSIKNEINELFAKEENRKLVIYPPSRDVKIRKGTEGSGFGLVIRNIENTAGIFSYGITAEETDCNMRLADAENLIALNKERSNINIPPGSIMEDSIVVKFNIPETAPPCKITYVVTMKKDNVLYGSSTDVYLTVESK